MPSGIAKNLEAAADDLRSCKAEFERVRRVTQAQTAALAEARARHATALATLGKVESEIALGRPGDLRKLRATFLEERNNLDFLEAAVRGLNEQLTIAERNREAAQDGFNREWLGYASDRVEEFQKEFDTAVWALYAVVDRGLGLSTALFETGAGSRLHLRLRQILSTPVLSIDNDRKKFMREHEGWQNNPQAVAEKTEIEKLKAHLLRAED